MYERALDKLEKASPPNLELKTRLHEKIRQTKEALAHNHKQNAEEMIEGGYHEEARPAVELALELTENFELKRELERMLKKLERRFPSLGDLEEATVVVSQGLELRDDRKSDEEVEFVEEVIEKNRLDMTSLKRLRHLFSFPSSAIVPVETELRYVRKGRAQMPLSICRPPHVIVSAARNFAVYSEEFLVVPPRQIGIACPSKDKDFLKALSLYLSSEFTFYHQFITSTEFGVKRDRSTLSALRVLPIAIAELTRGQLNKWARLH
ncbi:hypothetical protein LCGC14_2168620, partial [marine sediment metagenome]